MLVSYRFFIRLPMKRTTNMNFKIVYLIAVFQIYAVLVIHTNHPAQYEMQIVNQNITIITIIQNVLLTNSCLGMQDLLFIVFLLAELVPWKICKKLTGKGHKHSQIESSFPILIIMGGCSFQYIPTSNNIVVKFTTLEV